MRIAICDDDEQELAHLLELIMEYQVSHEISFDCHSFHNSTDFLCNAKSGEYDLVFLDVLMPGVSGIQAARELRILDQNVRLVFISSSSDFAVESYSVGACHYLLKPADSNSLFPLLDRIKSELSVQQEECLILKSRGGVVGVSFINLEYVEVINKTVSFHLSDSTIHEVPAALADFEERLLARPEFLKPHRSYIINLNHVHSIGTNCVVMKSGHSIPVSRRLHNQVRDVYIHFLFPEGTDSSASDVPIETAPEKTIRSDGSWKILLVDDNPAERTFWADILRHHGCIVRLAGNGEDALKLASQDFFDCVLLDVMIPGEDGFTICEKLHRLVPAPVIFLSCLTETDKQLEGFAAGGIDYITKNTPAELFWAKVETRIMLAMSGRTRLCYGPLLLDLAKHQVLINEQKLNLTPIEFDLLHCLSGHPGHIFSPEEVFDMVWSGQPWDGGQTVQLHMSRLRRKLEKTWKKHQFIETVWGQGYRFVPTDN